MNDTTPTPQTPLSAPKIHPSEIRVDRNHRLLLVSIAIVIVSLVYGAYWWTTGRHWVQTDNAYVIGNLVPVAAQASGIVT